MPEETIDQLEEKALRDILVNIPQSGIQDTRTLAEAYATLLNARLNRIGTEMHFEVQNEAKAERDSARARHQAVQDLTAKDAEKAGREAGVS